MGSHRAVSIPPVLPVLPVLAVACFATFGTFGMVGCQLGPKDLDAYSRTAAGPAKIRVVVEDDGYPDALRAAAVVKLLDLERGDVDGTRVALDALARMPVGKRAGILGGGGGVLERMGPRLSPTGGLRLEEQVAIKDALTQLAELAEGDTRARYGDVLVEWYVRDLAPRAKQGTYDLPRLVNILGSLAAPPLTAALHARISASDLRQLASLLAGVAQGKERSEAALKLIDIEARWRSEGRVTQLEAELKDVIGAEPSKDAEPASKSEESEKAVKSEQADKQAAKTAAQPAGPARPGRPAEAGDNAQDETHWLKVRADTRRHSEIETALLPALGWFADTREVAERLYALAESSDTTIPDAQRQLALTLLTDHALPEQVGGLLELALDRVRPTPLRVLALSRAAEHAGSDHLSQLLALISDRRHRQLRQRAAELVLDIGGAAAMPAFFRAMPKAWAMEYSRSELESYVQRLVTFDPTPQIVNYLSAKLHSPYWWARVLALRYFAQRGSLEDLWRIRQHVHDYLQIRGPDFPEVHTVGQEAQAAVAVALRRLRSGKIRAAHAKAAGEAR